MAKIPIILEPGRADGKLAESQAIYDSILEQFQSDINGEYKLTKEQVEFLTPIVERLNDIQDTLTSIDADKPLSAQQGKILKELLDSKVIEIGAIPLDSEPTEGNTKHIVTSDGIYKSLSKRDNKLSELEERIDYADSNKYINVEIDKDGKIYSAITADGKKVEYLPTDFIGGATLNKEKIATMKSLDQLATKEEVSRVEEDVKKKIDITENDSFTEVTIDADGKIVESRNKKGIKTFHTDIIVNGTEIRRIDSNSIIEARTDKNGTMYMYVTKDGKVHIPLLDDGKIAHKNGCINAFKGQLNDGEILSISDAPDVKINCDLSFHAEIISFGKIKLSHGEVNSNHGIIEVDSVNVYEYGANGDLKKTTPHGLTMTDYIDINVHVSGSPTAASVNIDTNGGNYKADISWGGARNEVKAYAVNGSYCNCQITFGGSAFFKDIWVFGDSYSDMWSPQMNTLGYTNYLCDGWGGRKSVEAYLSLQRCLMLGKPKIIVWLLGMNDSDSEGAINSEYKNTLDKLIVLCNKNDIRLAVGTIPNTPVTLHVHKNDYIRSLSNIQVIDVAKAFGADYAGATWYSGLRTNTATDKIHPTSSGCKLYAKFLSNEIPMIK